MSDIHITLERIEEILPHPNADRLEIAKILGTYTVVAKGQWSAGDLCVFFPPDIMIPEDVAERLGVAAYLKDAQWGDVRRKCRVAACRLRGIPSYGFIAKTDEGMDLSAVGASFDNYYGAAKYEPPARVQHVAQGIQAYDPPNFPKYTEIQHYYRNTWCFPQGLPVRVTEKIHGTNCRVGFIKMSDQFEFVCGSHRLARKQFDTLGRESVYWTPLTNPRLKSMILCLHNGINDVVVYGEIFGPGVQDMTYGVPAGQFGFRLFDISLNGRYMDWELVDSFSWDHGVMAVPMLYRGPFDAALVEGWTNGPTVVCGGENTSKFKGREGCVITPLSETYDHRIGRVVAKSVSADYLARKGAMDEGEM